MMIFRWLLLISNEATNVPSTLTFTSEALNLPYTIMWQGCYVWEICAFVKELHFRTNLANILNYNTSELNFYDLGMILIIKKKLDKPRQ